MLSSFSRSLLFGTFLGVGLLVCASGRAAAGQSTDIAPSVSVRNAWIRWLPANLPAAGYATVQNYGDRPVTLTGASTPDYAATMFHQSRNEDGVERMMMIDSVRIEPHSEMSFAPDGFHIMLMQPMRAIQPGDHVLLTLRFADGRSVPVQFDVRRSDGSAVKRATDASRP